MRFDDRGSDMQRVSAAPYITSERLLTSDAGDEDAALVVRAKNDPAAFADLYHRYLEPVYAYCWYRLGSREAAEDATSQIFLKALAALPSYRGDRTFRSWLFTIAHNVVVDQYRTQRPSRPLEDATNVADSDNSPEDLGVAAADAAAMRTMFAYLTPDQARVIELRLAGLTESEIAQVLNRRAGAIRATQFRALGRLRTLLGASPTQKGDARG